MGKSGVDTNIDKLKRNAETILSKNSDKRYLRSYLNFLGDSKSWSTKIVYLRHIVNFMDFAKCNPRDLELDDYIDYMATIEGVSSYKINTYHALQSFSKYLYASDKCAKDYMGSVQRPTAVEDIKTIKRREKGYLTDNEVKATLINVEKGVGSNEALKKQSSWKERDKAIVVLLLTTGLRCTALLSLDIDNIDLENGVLITFEKGRKPVEKYLTEDACRVLAEWITVRDSVLGNSDEKALFISNRKGRISKGAVVAIVNKYTSNIQGKKISPHKFRATYATKILEKTNDIYLAQKAMGHSSPKTTELYIRGTADAVNTKQRDIMQNFLSDL